MAKKDEATVEVTAARRIISSPFGAHEPGDKFHVPASRVEKLERDGFITRGGKKAARDGAEREPE